ncbi:MAG: hypothetical protein A3A04_01930 [Candidatus Harrisonbacteria bacterium RIFCSPLOWO2_01_FULL_40_28]|uniref:histidine kinase n=1 Tax=Candidatus Harrisonbacteria bacterium RIFCSPLOWO2_01_FULL_40_28 TaxID=1798406 RepID=A0A1G1ZK20_9BACT|nr:MAG: hypothetical protein A3A04_01930 [Candidatus Harrisonbacteria bacterium RIFCSPLOWO2_01_FULL_40_28]
MHLKSRHPQLHAENQGFLKLMNNAAIGIHWVAPDGTILWANKADMELLGYKSEEYIGHNIREFHVDKSVPDDILAKLGNRKIIQGYEAKLIAKNESVKYVLIDSNAIWDGDTFLHTQCFILDITDRKRHEQALSLLANANTSLNSSLDYEITLPQFAHVIVNSYFANWCIIDLLKKDESIKRILVVHKDKTKMKFAKELLRYTPHNHLKVRSATVIKKGIAELYPKITESILHTAVHDNEHMKIVKELGLVSAIVVPIRSLSHETDILGAITFVSAESRHIYNAHDLRLAEVLGNKVGVYMENSRLYHEIQKAIKAKDEFLATLSHELRNPLAPIAHNLYMLDMQLKKNRNDAEIKESFSTIHHQFRNITRLLDDLLDVSRITRGKIKIHKQHIDVRESIAHAVNAVKSLVDTRNQKIITSFHKNEPLMLFADPLRIEQILVNLLNNASKYSKPEGIIHIEARKDVKKIETITIKVRDNGIGIPSESLKSIFDMFMQIDKSLTRSYGGLGIGLTLVKKLTELHKGNIEARSDGRDKGSQFILTFPLSNIESRRKEDALPPQTTPLAQHTIQESRGNKRIMIVDDNEDAALSLGKLLKKLGNNTRILHNAHSALTEAPLYKPDYLILDIGMPDMNGYEIAKKLKNDPNLCNTRFVALTGYGQEEDKIRSKEAGFHYHIVKPLEIEELKSIIN